MTRFSFQFSFCFVKKYFGFYLIIHWIAFFKFIFSMATLIYLGVCVCVCVNNSNKQLLTGQDSKSDKSDEKAKLEKVLKWVLSQDFKTFKNS